jgi:hypothetical protein
VKCPRGPACVSSSPVPIICMLNLLITFTNTLTCVCRQCRGSQHHMEQATLLKTSDWIDSTPFHSPSHVIIRDMPERDLASHRLSCVAQRRLEHPSCMFAPRGERTKLHRPQIFHQSSSAILRRRSALPFPENTMPVLHQRVTLYDYKVLPDAIVLSGPYGSI